MHKLVLGICAFCTLFAWGDSNHLSQVEFPKKVSEVVQQSIETFDVPGIAVGVLLGDQTLLERGYGTRNINSGLVVDAQTIFKIASNTKAFTVAALAILVDQGKLRWSDKIVDHLGEFELADDWISQHFTVLDMLTHRSGLGPGAGDLMLWPEPNDFTPQDIVKNLRYLKPAMPFRSDYAYDNLMYIVAGQLVERLSGISWQKFVQTQLLEVMQLERCFADVVDESAWNNLAMPHARLDGKLGVVERSKINDETTVMAAAGGMKCSLSDMLVWVHTLLNAGLTPQGRRLFSEQQSRIMWQPHMLMPLGDFQRQAYNTHFKAYGLGWRLEDIYGYLLVSHTGSLQGYRSYVAMVPELDLGIVILSNGSSSSARQAILFTILDQIIGERVMESQLSGPRDWVKILKTKTVAAETGLQDKTIDAAFKRWEQAVLLGRLSKIYNQQDYEGRYTDVWFGGVSISMLDKQLKFQADKSPKLSGVLVHKQEDTYMVFWDDRSLEADAYIHFERDNSGVVSGMKMNAISPATDFSFDFQDLHFTRDSAQ